MKNFQVIMRATYRFLIILVLCFVIWKTIMFLLPLPVLRGRDNVLSAEDSENQGKIKVSVYYEALCSDSRFFILKQLVPAYETIPGFIKLDLVPYGKAKTIEKDGKITFECQHAELECYANKIHACGLKYITEPGLQLKYIACMIDDNMMPRSAGEKCAQQVGINFDLIGKCSEEEEASRLLKVYGERTHSLSPPVTFIPTVELNGSQTKVAQSLILKNLLGEVCNLLVNKPNECL